MPLTVEQVKKRAKLALLGVPIGFGCFFLGLLLIILLDIDFPIPIIGFPIILCSIFYLVYLQIKYPEAVREIAKPYNKIQGGMLSDVVEGVDGKIVGSKIGEIIQSANIAKPSEPAIKVRCQSCGHLNDETDKFCGECGKPV